MARELPLPSWPGGAEVAVSITFDADAECGFLCEGAEYAQRLTSLSEARFGPVRGLPRILSLLEEASIPATFYVPGDTVERHTAAIENIVAAGHEIGHHGHDHLRSDKIGPREQRAEMERGLSALDTHLGVRPTGYRSASWEITPETFGLLTEFAFTYDSSCMGDDRPYLEEHGDTSIIELPVHWSLDDWPYFFWGIDGGGKLTAPSDFLQIWLDEFDAARRERRHITYTMHPEIIGRGYRMLALEEFLETIRQRADVWFATHAEVVAQLDVR